MKSLPKPAAASSTCSWKTKTDVTQLLAFIDQYQ